MPRAAAAGAVPAWLGAPSGGEGGGGDGEVGQAVAGAPLREQVLRVGRVVLDLLAQVADVDPQVVRVVHVLVAPYRAEQEAVGRHFPDARRERGQQPVL